MHFKCKNNTSPWTFVQFWLNAKQYTQNCNKLACIMFLKEDGINFSINGALEGRKIQRSFDTLPKEVSVCQLLKIGCYFFFNSGILNMPSLISRQLVYRDITSILIEGICFTVPSWLKYYFRAKCFKWLQASLAFEKETLLSTNWNTFVESKLCVF